MNWPRAYGGPAIRADFRTEPEDFIVEELAAPQEGEGEHVYLQIRKRGANTGWVAQQLAELAGVRNQDVGFFGLKDRHAVTTQWFSVWLAQKPEPDWTAVNNDETTVVQHYRGARKLRRGEHSGNRFRIRLRNIQGDRDAADQILARMSAGVPNYFGEQRFGRDGGNLDLAAGIVAAEHAGERRRLPRKQKTFAMSAARSWLFNQVLSARVSTGNWQEVLPGEPEAFPSGPLWGRGRNAASDEQLTLENDAMSLWAGWQDWLEHCGLSQERRPLVLAPAAFQYVWQDEGQAPDLWLDFALPPGAFATAVLGELAELVNQSIGTIK
nr:tRNA pseudouridine(13) synthase TruD [Microbulbifer celer]